MMMIIMMMIIIIMMMMMIIMMNTNARFLTVIPKDVVVVFSIGCREIL